VVLGADVHFDGFEPAWSRYREAVAHLFAGRLDSCVDIYADLAAQPGLAQILGRCGLLQGLPLAGRAEEATAIAEDTIVAARAHGNPFIVAMALFTSGLALAQADPARALGLFRDGLVYAQENGLSLFEAAIASNAAQLETAHGDLEQGLALFETALDSLHRAGNVPNLAVAFAYLAVCFDHFDRANVAATIYGASINQALSQFVVDLPAVEDRLRAALGDTGFDQCAATGAAMDLAEAVGYARHHIELARRQAANPDSGRR
jgi:hypothetical protein